MTRTVTSAAVALAMLVAAPAPASAASFTLAKPCIRENTPVDFALAGFAPDSFVRLLIDSDLIDAIRMGSDGGFVGALPAYGNGDAKVRAATITATDDAGITLTQPLAIVDLLVGMKPSKAKWSTKVEFRAQGFVEGGTLYAHYVYSKSQTSKKLLKTVKLGTVGACGTLTKKVKQLPFKKPKAGLYEIQFDLFSGYKRQREDGPYVERFVNVPKKR